MKVNKDNLFNILKIVAKYTLVLFVCLLYFELLLHYIINGSFSLLTIYNVLFLIPIALVLSALLGFHSKINSILLIVVVFLLSLFYIACLIYFMTFKSLPSMSMIGNGTDAVTNFWWSVEVTIKENVVNIILLEIPVVLLILEAIFLRKLNGSYQLIIRPMVLIVGICLWFLVVLALPLGGKADYTSYGAYHSRYVDTDTAANKLGILSNSIIETRYLVFGSTRENLIEIEEEEVEEVVIPEVEYNVYENLDFLVLKNKTTDSSLQNVCDYLNTQKPSNKNDHTGLFEGYNLIYICGESFSNMAIDPDITPTLYKLANNGYVLDNYYNSFKNVTTNGEYALLTGVWPDVAREETNNGRLTGTMGQSIDNNMSESLGKKFNKLGIQSRGFHNYWGSYYGREETLPNMGFDCMFMGKGMWFTTDWPASDLEMMQQSVKTYIDEEQFCVYYMTFSGHGNYSENNFMVQKNIEYVRSKAANKGYPDNLLGYFACNVELDKALEYLLDELDKAGKLDNTVIVLTGDHYPYYVSDYDYYCYTGEKVDNDSYNKYHSTCILYNAGMQKPIHVDTPCCNVDILPTILNLFGIEYDSRLYAGTDIFSDNKHVAMIYDKSFITKDCIYNATNGNIIWKCDPTTMTDYEQEKYINSYISYVKGKYAYSIAVESTDFYNFITNPNN